jgi:hypothetical protein
MGTAAKPTRENRTITVDFQNETTYFPHSIGFRGRQRSLDCQRRLPRDFPCAPSSQLRHLSEHKLNNISSLKAYHYIRGHLGYSVANFTVQAIHEGVGSKNPCGILMVVLACDFKPLRHRCGETSSYPGRLVTFKPRARNKSSSSHGLTPSNSANLPVEMRRACHC